MTVDNKKDDGLSRATAKRYIGQANAYLIKAASDTNLQLCRNCEGVSDLCQIAITIANAGKHFDKNPQFACDNIALVVDPKQIERYREVGCPNISKVVYLANPGGKE